MNVAPAPAGINKTVFWYRRYPDVPHRPSNQQTCPPLYAFYLSYYYTLRNIYSVYRNTDWVHRRRGRIKCIRQDYRMDFESNRPVRTLFYWIIFIYRQVWVWVVRCWVCVLLCSTYRIRIDLQISMCLVWFVCCVQSYGGKKNIPITSAHNLPVRLRRCGGRCFESFHFGCFYAFACFVYAWISSERTFKVKANEHVCDIHSCAYVNTQLCIQYEYTIKLYYAVCCMHSVPCTWYTQRNRIDVCFV